MLYNGDETEPDYYVWGSGNTQEVNQFCEDVTSWMKVVKLASVVRDICKDNNVSLTTEDRVKLHMNWERKKCADPRLGDFPAFEPSCMDDRLSVRHIGQE
eukprot:2926003-Amphidinium_carterae.1